MITYSRKFTYLFIVFFIFLFFIYGFAVGHFRIFPFKHLVSVRNYIERQIVPEKDIRRGPGSVIIQQTFLNRLFIKKIQLGPDIGYGGGLSTAGSLLFVTANKGKIYSYDLNTYTELENDIADVPMDLEDFLASGHHNRNEFRLIWFRVNGVHSEAVDSLTQVFYAVHNGYDSNRDCITYNISKTKLRKENQAISQIGDWQTIFTAEPCIDPEPEFWQSAVPYSGHISGGKIIGYDSEHLLVSIGDYNHHGLGNTSIYADDISNPYGKIILVNKESGSWSVYTMGHRNPSGLYRDKQGTIWSAENGPEGGDELNRIVKGENYGWPMVSYGVWYDASFDLPGGMKRGSHTGFKEPVFSWLPSVAPSNLIRIEGDTFDLWDGDLIVGMMFDRSLRRLRLNSDEQVVYDEKIDIGHRVRDILMLPEGEIAVLTDDSRLLIIGDGGPVYRRLDDELFGRMVMLDRFDGFVPSPSAGTEYPDHQTNAAALFVNKCGTCHGMNPGANVGPHLGDMFGREIGSIENYPYSEVLRRDTRKWTPDLLKNYLQTPEIEFLNSRMPKINMTPAEIDSVIQYIRHEH